MTRTITSVTIILLVMLSNLQIVSAADLIQAVKSGHSFLVELLVEQRYDVNVVNGSGETALTEAIRINRADFIYLLLKNGASPNLQNTYGDSPILFAIRKKDPDILKMLLESGADPNSIDRLARTPLIVAAKEVDKNEPSQQIVKLLLEFGADVNARDCFGRDALSYAMVMDEQMINSLVDKNFSIGKVRTEEERVRGILKINNYVTVELIQAGADISGWFEWSQLLKACVTGDLVAISSWKSGVFTINNQDGEGKSALSFALFSDQFDAAKLLIELGSNIERHDREIRHLGLLEERDLTSN